MNKVIAQIIIQASAVFTRAAAQAYGQALQNAKKGGTAAVSNAAARARAGKMQTAEALDILNIKKPDLNAAVMTEQFDKFYKLNDPAKGGSFYLQSKFYRAKEALEYEMNPDKPDEEIEADMAAATSGKDKEESGDNAAAGESTADHDAADSPAARRAAREKRRQEERRQGN